ncbi:MAG: 2-succinyl-5-enolpyruvyl-6-hydroxy-3-cyclohexene-1-carboxylic-acid synthase [Lentimicrobiaceae bacterium]|nr:2-succinyl-5-enolpyruvyl-6-hydroxy-3-cyclohexene-1-carboxylic-acid synthase [Lentimicrobiaceae bacterium]
MSNVHLGLLGEIMIRKGIRHVVVSPGSRNAPAIIRFNRISGLKLHAIVDERSAAYYALGMALVTGETVAILCTSGTAVLNNAPAIAEAYYQQIPLLVITDDRPVEWIDQGDRQTIRQSGIFANYIRKSFLLFPLEDDPQQTGYFVRLTAEAIDRTRFPVAGPVHLNVPLKEPLYDIEFHHLFKDIRIPSLAPVVNEVSAEAMETLVSIWNGCSSKLVLVGQLPVGHGLTDRLRQLASDKSVVVMFESTSNMNNESFIGCIDTIIEGMNPASSFRPELLLTIGGAIVSKKIKTLFRQMKPCHHWHVNPDIEAFHMDTYHALTYTLPVQPEKFLEQLVQSAIAGSDDFAERWKQRVIERQLRHSQFLTTLPFSDFKAYELIFNRLPAKGMLFLGNSTPVRYGQLFNNLNGYPVQSNRGTSGIDGCVSTAAGAAMLSADPVIVITGDIGFFYDSNALWNAALPSNLKIILMNNGGGNIFRVIPGPDRFKELEPFIEATHQLKGEDLARGFGLTYTKAFTEAELIDALETFFNENSRAALLEIFTPNKLSAQVLKDYFNYIKS